MEKYIGFMMYMWYKHGDHASFSAFSMAALSRAACALALLSVPLPPYALRSAESMRRRSRPKMNGSRLAPN